MANSGWTLKNQCDFHDTLLCTHLPVKCTRGHQAATQDKRCHPTVVGLRPVTVIVCTNRPLALHLERSPVPLLVLLRKARMKLPQVR